MKLLQTAVLLVPFISVPVVGNAADWSGRVTTVIDGDDIVLCDSAGHCDDIRLCGVDAPEQGCPAFDKARAALFQLVDGKMVRCVQVGAGTVCDGRSKPTNRGRIVAQCFVDGVDIAAVLVERGLACDWERFSGGHYSKQGGGRACPNNHRRNCTAASPIAR
jgi:endonuclease YncB( thermonuclease family)